MNSLLITVLDKDGKEITPVYECHSMHKAAEIIAGTVELGATILDWKIA